MISDVSYMMLFRFPCFILMQMKALIQHCWNQWKFCHWFQWEQDQHQIIDGDFPCINSHLVTGPERGWVRPGYYHEGNCFFKDTLFKKKKKLYFLIKALLLAQMSNYTSISSMNSHACWIIMPFSILKYMTLKFAFLSLQALMSVKLNVPAMLRKWVQKVCECSRNKSRWVLDQTFMTHSSAFSKTVPKIFT